MGTTTASQIGATPKANHTGLQVSGFVLTKSTTTTASHCFKLCKVPMGAIIWGAEITSSRSSATTTTTFKLGLRLPHTDATNSATWTVTESIITGLMLVSSETTHTGFHKLPVKVSFSNNHQVNYAWVEAVAISVCSNSVHMRGFVKWSLGDGDEPVTNGSEALRAT